MLQLKNGLKKVLSNLGMFDIYECPVCKNSGRFKPHLGRHNAKCWHCGALERHRLQFWVVSRLLDSFNPEKKAALQFAPDPLAPYFRSRFGSAQVADLYRDNVDLKLDIRSIDMPDQSIDFIFASHVLEHVDDDRQALSELRRILKPGGIAVLPVPIVADQTIEYPEPVSTEFNHVRAPGIDYFDRYREFFPTVEIYDSNDCPDRYQPFMYEDRSDWPTPKFPYRLPMPGQKHVDFVPVCRL